MHSIRFRITAITVAAILTSIVSVFLTCYATIQLESDRRAEEMMKLIGENTALSLESNFESIEQSVEMAANLAGDTLDSVMLVECGAAGVAARQGARTPEQTARLDAYLEGYCQRIQEAFASVANHTHGVESYYYCLSPDISRTQHGFYYSMAGKTGFEEQPPLDAGALDPEDIEHDTWYYTTIQRGRPSWIGPYKSDTPEELWICSYLVPIYGAGSFIGVLGMDIPLDTLVSYIRDIHVYETGFACLYDDTGRVIYHPELPVGTLLDGKAISIEWDVLRQHSGDAKMTRYTYGGQERQLSMRELSNGMKLIITVPTSEVNAAWVRLLRIILSVSVAIIVFFAILLMFVMGIITRPLKRLTVASQHLAAGDYEAELDYHGRDEVGKLTEAFTQMRDRQKLYVEDLNHQIYTDALTGLPNMRHFFKLAEQERSRLVERGEHPVMLYFNLIGMKHFNRQYGFQEGDRLIREVGCILAGHFGEACMCRYGQDHFAAMTSEEKVYAELEAIYRECQKANGGRSLPIRAGVYPYELGEVSVSVACDRAKYACDQHRGVYVSGSAWFNGGLLRRGERFRYVVNNLDRAISEGWIKLHYQAIIRAASGKVCDEEALARWIDPEKGFLSPAEFIPPLEEAKLIYKLDLYVVERVLEKMKQQAEAGLYAVSQSVNLSRADFDSCDMVEEIRRRVDEAGIERSRLNIEITESVVGKDYDFMKEQVGRFQALGFQVWMDDFGSGYSSLDVLQNIHFDLIKFDMRFMEQFDRGDECRIILTELTKMAIGLGVETVCEGVERKEQVDFLKEIGCTKIQGYYFGKPLSFEKMLSLYREGVDLGLENPEESEYFEAIGRINLYDMAVIAGEDDESFRRYFDTLPMGIIEVNGTHMKYTRCNRSYREFLKRGFNKEFDTEEIDYSGAPDAPGAPFVEAVMRCSRDGSRTMIDEKINRDTTIHAFIRRVAVNPVTGTAAIAVAVLAVIKDGEAAQGKG